MQARVGNSPRPCFKGVQVVDAEGPDLERDFDEEEGGDYEGEILESFNPCRGLLGGRWALREEEVVCKVREDAERVDDDL